MLVVPNPSYPVEGEKVVYNCIIIDKNKKAALDLRFTDNDDIPYQIGAGIFIIVNKYEGEYSFPFATYQLFSRYFHQANFVLIELRKN